MSIFKSIYIWLSLVIEEALKVTLSLYRLMIPVIIVVKILSELGAIGLLGSMLSPVMGLMGLPGEAGLIWAAAIFTNIYGSIATLLSIYPDGGLSIQQMTILSAMILVCHTLPIELALCQKVGGSFKLLAPLRFLGAIVFGIILHFIYSPFIEYSQPASINWIEQNLNPSFYAWLYNQVINLLFVPCVLTALLIMVRLFDLIGINRFLSFLLQPILKLTGISSSATNIAIFGLLAGITFGSGLLLAEAKKKAVAARDVVLVLALLSLCHALIEDTILMLLIGADLNGILFGRIIFSVLVIAIFSKLPDKYILRFSSDA